MELARVANIATRTAQPLQFTEAPVQNPSKSHIWTRSSVEHDDAGPGESTRVQSHSTVECERHMK